MPLSRNDDTPARSGTWGTVECGAHRWQVRSEFANATWFLDHLAHPTALLEPPAQPLRPFASLSPRTIVRRIFRELPDRPVIIKRYRQKSFWGPWKDLFRGSQVWRTLKRTQELEALGVPVAGVMAAQVRSRGGWGESWLIMDEVPAAQNLYDRNVECRDSLDRRGLIRKLSRLMARLHDRDYEHTDPSLTNFLVSFVRPGRPTVVLIDLDGLRRRRQSLDRVAKGLRRLAVRAPVSHRECLRFLIEYVHARQRPVDPRALAQAVGALRPGASSPSPWTDRERMNPGPISLF